MYFKNNEKLDNKMQEIIKALQKKYGQLNYVGAYSNITQCIHFLNDTMRIVIYDKDDKDIVDLDNDALGMDSLEYNVNDSFNIDFIQKDNKFYWEFPGFIMAYNIYEVTTQEIMEVLEYYIENLDKKEESDLNA